MLHNLPQFTVSQVTDGGLILRRQYFRLYAVLFQFSATSYMKIQTKFWPTNSLSFKTGHFENAGGILLRMIGGQV